MKATDRVKTLSVFYIIEFQAILMYNQIVYSFILIYV